MHKRFRRPTPSGPMVLVTPGNTDMLALLREAQAILTPAQLNLRNEILEAMRPRHLPADYVYDPLNPFFYDTKLAYAHTLLTERQNRPLEYLRAFDNRSQHETMRGLTEEYAIKAAASGIQRATSIEFVHDHGDLEIIWSAAELRPALMNALKELQKAGADAHAAIRLALVNRPAAAISR